VDPSIDIADTSPVVGVEYQHSTNTALWAYWDSRNVPCAGEPNSLYVVTGYFAQTGSDTAGTEIANTSANEAFTIVIP
jgi:hypothetical protein